MINDGLWDVYNEFHMGAAAEMVAEKYGISREEQDTFAAESHRRAAAATAEGRFREADSAGRSSACQKGGSAAQRSTRTRRFGPIPPSRFLLELKPAFKEGGTVTAGNAPGVSDGAAAVVVTSAGAGKGTGNCSPWQ